MIVSLNGLPLLRCLLVLPVAGIWHADLTLVQDVPSAGPQTLTLGAQAYVGAIVRDISFAGRREVRLVGGTGGWRRVVPARQYGSPAGIPTAMVVGDVAGEVQELPPVLDPSVPALVGNAFIRLAGTASLVLWQALGDTWWLDPTGVVQTAPRLPTLVPSPFVATGVRGAPGVYTIATDSPEDWTPGRLFAGPTVQGTIGRVMHAVRGDIVRTEVQLS